LLLSFDCLPVTHFPYFLTTTFFEKKLAVAASWHNNMNMAMGFAFPKGRTA
jgi:hypothetical protein